MYNMTPKGMHKKAKKGRVQKWHYSAYTAESQQAAEGLFVSDLNLVFVFIIFLTFALCDIFTKSRVEVAAGSGGTVCIWRPADPRPQMVPFLIYKPFLSEFGLCSCICICILFVSVFISVFVLCDPWPQLVSEFYLWIVSVFKLVCVYVLYS